MCTFYRVYFIYFYSLFALSHLQLVVSEGVVLLDHARKQPERVVAQMQGPLNLLLVPCPAAAAVAQTRQLLRAQGTQSHRSGVSRHA